MSASLPEIRQWSSWILQWSVMVLVIWWPLRDVLSTGRFRTPFFSMWGGMIGWSILVGYLSPLLVLAFSEDVKTFEYFPDIKTVTLYAAFGWLPALFFCSIGRLIRAGWNALSASNRPRGLRSSRSRRASASSV